MNKALAESTCPTSAENELAFGYPPSICDDIPRSKYLCSNCNNILKMAQQTACGHQYCSSCLAWIVRNQTQCPICKKEDPASLNEDSLLREVFSDTAINKEISDLRVHCLNPGCNWRGILKDYDDHQSLCDYSPISCHTACGHQVIRKNLADHLERECPNNVTVCPKCSQCVPINEFPKHKCDKTAADVQFPKKTEHLAKGKNGIAHPKKDKCRFAELGCTFVGSREKLKEHERVSVGLHLSLMFPLLLQVKNGFQSSRVTEKGLREALPKNSPLVHLKDVRNGEIEADCNQKVSSSCEGLGNKISALDARIQVFENIVTVLNREIEGCNAHVSILSDQKAEEQRKVKVLEQKVDQLRGTLAMKEVAVKELEARVASLTQATYNGIFLWKITDLAQKCQDAVTGRAISLYSPAFYTAKYGYKVCLRIYLNGDGAGKGTHISLFFTVMKGEYDALLTWPFKHKVTFVLEDHNTQNHVVDAFRPDVTSPSFQRPLHEMNVASGCPLFCSLSKLQSPRHVFIKDNSLYIKCVIDTNS
ncbi:hypothetical protein GDO86_014881 [Hymenochirus boettgeri]|uniref:TNF receptor-associated factor n=1 Tax=Hymenochirus boettgeri TaxID=247094 RepID=A0A8T2JVM4_9PIPI|nr:hypothetical protein GDO86_014881 [Hymenochirus boettgeri]